MGADAEKAKAAVAATDTADLRRVRFQFIRNSPDICAYMMAPRAEFHMRMVMLAVVPHTKRCNFGVMACYEVGQSGNGHYHGMTVGSNTPSLKRVKEDVAGAGAGSRDVPVVAANLNAEDPPSIQEPRAEREDVGAADDAAKKDGADVVP